MSLVVAKNMLKGDIQDKRKRVNVAMGKDPILTDLLNKFTDNYMEEKKTIEDEGGDLLSKLMEKMVRVKKERPKIDDDEKTAIDREITPPITISPDEKMHRNLANMGR